MAKHKKARGQKFLFHRFLILAAQMFLVWINFAYQLNRWAQKYILILARYKAHEQK